VELGKTAIRTRLHASLGLLAAGGLRLGVHELAVLLGAGLLALARRRGETPALALAAAPLPRPRAILLVFLKLGAVVFAGYVLLAFLRTDSSPVCTG